MNKIDLLIIMFNLSTLLYKWKKRNWAGLKKIYLQFYTKNNTDKCNWYFSCSQEHKMLHTCRKLDVLLTTLKLSKSPLKAVTLNLKYITTTVANDKYFLRFLNWCNI